MIKVLIVDDSPSVREFLGYILGSDPGIRVIGTANNGEEAVEFVRHDRPDVITMDINMPKMNGLEATRQIMETHPAPIVIVSGSWDAKEVETTFRAMEAGALAIVQKPQGFGHPDQESAAKELVQTVKLMSEVKVVRRWARRAARGTRDEGVQRTSIVPPEERMPATDIRVAAIGASTGGPLVLQTILSGLPKDFAVPILIVQHMAPGFLQGMVDWLGQSSSVPLRIAVDGEEMMPGHAYFAPDGFNMGVANTGRISLEKDGPRNGAMPSVSYLFHSVMKTYREKAVGVLLTGMGKDGAEELKVMKEKGAFTIVQDRESSVVYGMPGVAFQLDAATYVLPPDKIAAVLTGLTGRRKVYDLGAGPA